MNPSDYIGKSYLRKDSRDKVTGNALYTADYQQKFYYASLVTSEYAHAEIIRIDTNKAKSMDGVLAILTGLEYPILTGPIIVDRPVIAIKQVRYYGEPVAIVVADTDAHAKNAASKIKVHYKPLKVINSVEDSLNPSFPLLHPYLGEYKKSVTEAEIKDVFPIPKTNVANLQKIRKGTPTEAFNTCDVVIENSISFTQSDHAPMETHCCFCNIQKDGQVNIHSSSQGPFVVKEYISKFFNVPEHKVNVTVPFVGGAYGGKTPVIIECLCYLASKAVNGHMVKLLLPRDEDMITCAVHIGLTATIRLGATKDGRLKAYHSIFYFDGGAYSDKAVVIARAAAQNCTGPYKVDNVYCDSYCLYTNHTFATAYRGFGHAEMTFAVERAMDILAKKLHMDPLKLRYINAIQPDDTTPTDTILVGKVGNLHKCIDKLKETLRWDEQKVIHIGKDTVRTKGIACFWKSFSVPTDCVTGTILNFMRDGSVNLICGLIDIGQGTKSALAQIVSEVLTIPYNKIHVVFSSNTSTAPHDWKTAASRGMSMCGNATLQAAQQVKDELLSRASFVLHHNKEDLFMKDEKIYVKTDPTKNIAFKDLVLGYTFPNGNSIMGEIIGSGTDIVNGLTPLNKNTGKGNPATGWTVAAQAVEIEINLRTYQYKMRNAYTVIDAGTIINPALARVQVMGGMNMGLSFGSREKFYRTKEGITLNDNLRTYPIIRYGEVDKFIVGFVETPQIDGPYGAGGIGEHGVIGMPAALSNALSNALKTELNTLPLTPEILWRNKEGHNDRV